MVLIPDQKHGKPWSFTVVRCPKCKSVIIKLGPKSEFLFRCMKNGHTFTGEELGLKRRE